MKIIILDMLISQYENREVATTSLKRIEKELRTLSKIVDQGRDAVLAYFTKGNDGKPFHGLSHGVPVYKYDLTDGDRILYVHGTSLSYLSEEDKDSYVLVSYAPHDLQEKIAKTGHFFLEHEYCDLKDYVETVDESDELTDIECENIAALFFGNFKASVIDEKELVTLTADDLDKRVLLTKEQSLCLEEWRQCPVPTLITGGAGTGKTVMSIRLLESFVKAQNYSSAVYFTQSNELRKKGKRQLCTLLNSSKEDIEEYTVKTYNQNKIDFYNINDYCSQKLGIPESNCVFYDSFVKDFCQKNLEVQRLCGKSNLSFFDVWTDIRGVIKGSLNEFWQRRKSVSQFEYSEVSSLVKKGELVRLENNPQQVKLSCSTRDARKHLMQNDTLLPKEKNSLKKIIEAFETIDKSVELIPLDEYLLVSNEISLFSVEQRKCVYKICEYYQKWLKNEGMYDENDLAMRMLCEEKKEKYDFIIVDEVQDYTELQIFLIYNLCDNKNAFVFAGDIHQIINPTVFDHKRLKKLFLNDEGTESALRITTLTSNYRCQQGIVDAANRLSDLRRKTIANKEQRFESEEKSHDPTIISLPIRVSYSPENLKALMTEVMKHPRAGVLVADEDTRDKLISIIGQELYEENPCVFTASEIKGVEYQYVVCVDVFSSNYKEWQKILNSNGNKNHETRRRFYFNIVYVALTRAQLHICFMDQRPVSEIDEILSFEQHNIFDPIECHFSDLGTSISDWYEQAREYQENGIYDMAIKYYERAGEDENRMNIIECRIGLAESEKDYVNLIKYALLSSNISLAKRYKNEKIVPEELRGLVDWFASPVTKRGIIQVINNNFKDFSQKEIDILYSNVKTKLRKEAREVLKKSIVMGGAKNVK